MKDKTECESHVCILLFMLNRPRDSAAHMNSFHSVFLLYIFLYGRISS